MLHNIGHFIGVRGGANEKDFRTFTAFSDMATDFGDFGVFKDGGVLNASYVMERCGVIKPRDRFIVTPSENGYVYATERYATCIEADEEKGRCYIIPHNSGEYVGFKKIGNFGAHDGGVVSIDLPQLMHIRKVGIITSDVLGNAGAQNFTIGIGYRGDDDDNAGTALTPADFIKFNNNTPANTVKMADCDCICSRVTLTGDMNNNNTGEGYMFFIGDTNTTLEYESGTIALNTIDFIYRFPTVIYATLSECSWVGMSSIAPSGTNRFVVQKFDNTPLTTTAALNGRPVPTGAGINRLSGENVKILQSTQDNNNAKSAVKFRLAFKL